MLVCTQRAVFSVLAEVQIRGFVSFMLAVNVCRGSWTVQQSKQQDWKYLYPGSPIDLCCVIYKLRERAEVGFRDDAAEVGFRDDATEVGFRDDATEVGSRDDATEVGSRDDSAEVGSRNDAAEVGSRNDGVDPCAVYICTGFEYCKAP